MALDLITFGDSLQNLINKNNTTSSSFDVSGSLNERVTEVIRGYHSAKPIPDFKFPLVYVELATKTEEFAQLGRTAKRNITLQYNIIGVTDYGLGLSEGREAADDEMIQLSSNMEELFRNYPKLSNTAQVQSAIIDNVIYDVVEGDGTYNASSVISLSVNIYSD